MKLIEIVEKLNAGRQLIDKWWRNVLWILDWKVCWNSKVNSVWKSYFYTVRLVAEIIMCWNWEIYRFILNFVKWKKKKKEREKKKWTSPPPPPHPTPKQKSPHQTLCDHHHSCIIGRWSTCLPTRRAHWRRTTCVSASALSMALYTKTLTESCVSFLHLVNDIPLSLICRSVFCGCLLFQKNGAVPLPPPPHPPTPSLLHRPLASPKKGMGVGWEWEQSTYRWTSASLHQPLVVHVHVPGEEQWPSELLQLCTNTHTKWTSASLHKHTHTKMNVCISALTHTHTQWTSASLHKHTQKKWTSASLHKHTHTQKWTSASLH